MRLGIDRAHLNLGYYRKSRRARTTPDRQFHITAHDAFPGSRAQRNGGCLPTAACGPRARRPSLDLEEWEWPLAGLTSPSLSHTSSPSLPSARNSAGGSAPCTITSWAAAACRGGRLPFPLYARK